MVIEGYQRPTMKLLDDMKTLLKDSETVALIVKFSKRLYKYDRLKISIYQKFTHLGGFQLLDLIIPELKSHVILYKFKSSHWLKLQHSDWRANLVKDFFLQMNFPPMAALEFIRDYMTFKLRYNQI